MTSKASERLNISAEGAFVSAAEFKRFVAVAINAGAASFVLQARKAKDAAGTGATNHGDAVTFAPPSPAPESFRASLDIDPASLGEGYTHVSFTSTGETSGSALLIGVDPVHSGYAIAHKH